jgi:sialate O-acetylesterase
MHQNRPGGMFDTMVSTLVPFVFRAVVFYQGCSDHERGRVWGRCYRTMVEAWRKAFEQPKWPFLSIQVAGYSYPGVGEDGIMTVREGQSDSADNADQRYLVSAVDLGEEQNIHPRSKRPVAERAAAVLLEKLYGIGEHSASPMIDKIVRRKQQIVLTVKGNKLPLTSRGRSQEAFRYSFDGKTFHTVDQIEVTPYAIHLKVPAEARWIDYAWANYPTCDVYSTNGLPLLPFRKPIETDEPKRGAL